MTSTSSRPLSSQPAVVLPQPAAHGLQFSAQPATHGCGLGAPRGLAPREQRLGVSVEDAREAHASEHGERHHRRDEKAHHRTAGHPAAVLDRPGARGLPGGAFKRRLRRRRDGLGEARLHLADVLPHLGGVLEAAGLRAPFLPLEESTTPAGPHRSPPLRPELGG